LVARAKTEIDDAAPQPDLIELIETVILYKLPRLTREEVQTMLKVDDIRQIRVYQEGVEEEEVKGAANAIVRMAAKEMSVSEIAAILELEPAFVQQVIEGAASDKSA
jgi:predicted transposase YdaD